MTRRLPDGAPGSPVLRTRGSVLAECEHADADITSSSEPDSAALDIALSPSPSSSSSPASGFALPQQRVNAHARHGSTASSSATTRHTPGRHAHQLTYLTSRHPAQPTLYTALRHSCIRALSLENLPRGTPSGPLLFGEPQSGHTIAFIFRLPDPLARGRRRTYALLALNPAQDAARVGRAMARVVALFRQIAAWITGLAERAGEHAAAGGGSHGSDALGSGGSGSGFGSRSGAGFGSSTEEEIRRGFDAVSIHDPDAPASPDDARHAADDDAGPPVSSFLSAKRLGADGLPTRRRRIYGGGGGGAPTPMPMPPPGSANGPGPKGLPELVGREGLFVELHVAFVRALMMLGREFGGAP